MGSHGPVQPFLEMDLRKGYYEAYHINIIWIGNRVEGFVVTR